MIELDKIQDLNCFDFFLYPGATCWTYLKLTSKLTTNNFTKMLLAQKPFYRFCLIFYML